MSTLRDSAGRVTRSTCKGGHRHWFAYGGRVGSSAPTCTRHGCDAPNPNYRPDDDPMRLGDGEVRYRDLYDDIRRARMTDTVEETYADRWEGTDYNGVDTLSGLAVVLHWNAETEKWEQVDR